MTYHTNERIQDVMNECHDHASWGKGDPMTDFNRYVRHRRLYRSIAVTFYLPTHLSIFYPLFSHHLNTTQRQVERFILFINERVPAYKGLFFVEGIFLNAYGKAPSPYPYWVRKCLRRLCNITQTLCALVDNLHNLHTAHRQSIR